MSAEEKSKVKAVIEDLIRACGSGVSWMDQVDRAKIASSTRGILRVDMVMCSTAIFQGKKLLSELQ